MLTVHDFMDSPTRNYEVEFQLINTHVNEYVMHKNKGQYCPTIAEIMHDKNDLEKIKQRNNAHTNAVNMEGAAASNTSVLEGLREKLNALAITERQRNHVCTQYVH